MHVSLALRHGVLWVARCVRTAHLSPFDLDGRALSGGFSFRGLDGGRAEIRGIAVDEDRRLWVADAASGSLRAFTFSGSEVACIRSRGDPGSDRPGALGDAGAIAVQGVEAEARLLVSRRGWRRHALLLLDPSGEVVLSFRPAGDPQGTFANLAGVALAGRMAYACEAGSGSVQVFRDGEFHYRIQLPVASTDRGPPAPRAVAPLADGRVLVACGAASESAVLLFDANGRCAGSLAVEGCGEGEVLDPRGLAVQEGDSDRTTRVVVLDRDGERVQVFTLDGRCYGSFVELDPGVLSPLTRAGGPALTREKAVELDEPELG
jgi:hypothetical protein